MAKNNKLCKVKISGIIFLSEWEEDDDIVGVILSTPDEEEYRIANNHKGRELSEYISHHVIVEGYLEEHENDEAIITVKDYEVLGEEMYEDGVDFYEDDFDFWEDDDSRYNGGALN